MIITIDIETAFEKNSTLLHDRNSHQIWYIKKISQKGIYEKDGPFDIYDRNGMDLTEAEDIKKRWQEYTEELYKEDLHEPDNHNGVITHLKPDILECQVKWALGSIKVNKASGGDGIPVELFQTLKDDWCCESAAFNMSANLENSTVATELEKVSFHSNPKARQCQRLFQLLHNYTHLTH